MTDEKQTLEAEVVSPPIRDERGRFLKGVKHEHSFKVGDPRINRKGKPKGRSWAAILEEVMEKELAKGITKETFMIKMVQRAFDNPNDKVAGKFISDLIEKPTKKLEINSTNKFVVPDLYADRRKELTDGETIDGELTDGESYDFREGEDDNESDNE